MFNVSDLDLRHIILVEMVISTNHMHIIWVSHITEHRAQYTGPLSAPPALAVIEGAMEVAMEYASVRFFIPFIRL